MRDIKFRGMQVVSSNWAYGFVVINKDGSAWIKDTDYNVNNGKFDLIPSKVTPETVGQFTGLFDKNGKEIYEGDIVLVDSSFVAGSFEDGVYRVTYTLPDCAFVLDRLYGEYAIGFNECYVYEVIGNIHENPELLYHNI